MWQFFSVRSFYYGVAIQSPVINVPPLSIVKMWETSRLFILISAYEGGVGHVYSQSRGRGQRKIFWDGAPDPDIFCPPLVQSKWQIKIYSIERGIRSSRALPSSNVPGYDHREHSAEMDGGMLPTATIIRKPGWNVNYNLWHVIANNFMFLVLYCSKSNALSSLSSSSWLLSLRLRSHQSLKSSLHWQTLVCKLWQTSSLETKVFQSLLV